ncbi:MAG: flavodoxin family protein, partial [Anaerolineae bacterium]
MKIVGISGSPRKGNSEFMLRTVLEKAKELGAETELILLRERDVKLCDGCKFCDREIGKCSIKDDFEKIFKSVKEADAVVFASGVWYDMITPQLLNIIDRMNPYTGEVKGKKFAFVLSGSLKDEEGKESQSGAIDFLTKHVAPIYEWEVIG